MVVVMQEEEEEDFFVIIFQVLSSWLVCSPCRARQLPPVLPRQSCEHQVAEWLSEPVEELSQAAYNNA